MSDFYIPSSPQDVTINQLTKGMDSSVPTKDLPDGSFLKVKGFDVVEKGLKRHGVWTTAVSDPATGNPIAVPLEFSDERIEDMFSMLMTTGVSKSFVVTNRLLYRMIKGPGTDELCFTPIFWKEEYTAAAHTPYDAGPPVVPEELTYTGDLTAVGVDTNCYVWVSDGSGGGYKSKIATITYGTGTTTITLATALTAWPADDAFRILKPFKATGEFFVDFTIANFVTYLVDTYSNVVFSFDGGDYLDYIEIENSAGTRTMYGARSVTWFNGRLFFCDVTEPNGVSTWYHRQRVRWTDPLNPQISESGWYQDLTAGQGSIIKIFGLGPVIAAYQEDAVYIGRETNLTMLPYAFQQVTTGGISLVGMKAVDGYFGGQIWAGRDNVYVLTSDGAVNKIGTQISNDSMLEAVDEWRTVIRADPLNYRVILGVSRQGTLLDTLFFYNIRSQAWSMQDDPNLYFQAFSTIKLTDSMSWTEAAGDAWNASPLALISWFEKFAGVRFARFHAVTANNCVVEYWPTGAHHRIPLGAALTETPVAAIAEIETQDFTFGAPDMRKTLLRFGFDIEEALNQKLQVIPRLNDIHHRLEWSEDHGRTWRPLGQLTFQPEDDEDALNFRATSQTIRLKWSVNLWTEGGDNDVQPYFITAINMRVRGRGGDPQGNTTRPQTNA